SDIAKSGNGQILYSSGTDDIINKIRDILEPPDPEKKIDLILTIDATASMADDIKSLRSLLPPLLEELLSEYSAYRVGLVLYKDYNDEFWSKSLPVRTFPFTSNFREFSRSLDSFRVYGGRDITEAVYEALYASLVFYDWDPDAIKRVILIGDAEPHPVPRGSGLYSKDLIDSLIVEKDAEVDVIVLMEKTSPN
ncbi:MAG: VWA domain-containing protein, partial [Spirochaetaceae bacterium]|nr:VWA domain-containing protein [Spirochaetaceae bacterium]